MKKFTQSVYQSAESFLLLTSTLLLALLSISAFLLTCYAQDMTTQQVLTKWDNPLSGLLGIICFWGLLYGMVRFVTRNIRRRLPLLLVFVMGWCLLLGMLLVLFGKTAPAADAWSVYDIAQNLAMGNTGVVHPTESYLSYYPQQVGLAAFFEGITRLCRLAFPALPTYHYIKCLYVFLLCLTIYFQYRTVHLLWQQPAADILYLILAAGNLPWIMYTSFVYGEIPSFALLSVGIYLMQKLLSSPSHPLLLALGSLFSLSLAVLIRKNSLIFIIAIGIVVFLQWFKNRQRGLLVYTILLFLCAIYILPLSQSLLEHRAGSSLQSGVPALSYLAMGMQESSRGNGWYNAFNFDTYQAVGMDTEAANQVSKEAILERLDYFTDHPAYAFSFYWQKYLTQWADGSFACRQATLATFGGRSSFFQQLYAGDYSPLFLSYCNLYQNVIYTGSLFFVLRECRRRRRHPTASPSSLPAYLGLIVVLGGFLFHMIWEANSRYIFLYSLMLLPYAAMGILQGLTLVHEKICSITHS